MTILLKRGTAEANDAYTGYPGEVTVDITAKSLRIHDGVTEGGVTQVTEDNFEAFYNQYFPAELDPTNVNLSGGVLNAQAVEFKVANEYGWRDLYANIDVRVGSANTIPALAVFRNSIYAYEFPKNRSCEFWAQFVIGHDYALGTKVHPKVHWGVLTTGTGTVRWSMEFTVAKGYSQGTPSVFSATSVVHQVTTISSGVQYQNFTSELDVANAIPADKLEPGSVILMRFYRDGSADTFGGSVFGFKASLHYQAARFATKNRIPNFYT